MGSHTDAMHAVSIQLLAKVYIFDFFVSSVPTRGKNLTLSVYTVPAAMMVQCVPDLLLPAARI